MAKIDWIIHCCANGVVCDKCNKIETGFLENTCNAHTHGMEKYHHFPALGLQIFPQLTCYIGSKRLILAQ